LREQIHAVQVEFWIAMRLRMENVRCAFSARKFLKTSVFSHPWDMSNGRFLMIGKNFFG
jgi:hypothetical protein